MVTAQHATCSLTRAISFHATHSYTDGGVSDPHGHLYRIEVTIRGQIGPARQTLIDLATLDRLLTQEVAEPLGGRHLNDAMRTGTTPVPTPSCEAVAVWCWQRIAPRLPGDVMLERVRVAEDATLWADCTGTD